VRESATPVGRRGATACALPKSPRPRIAPEVREPFLFGTNSPAPRKLSRIYFFSLLEIAPRQFRHRASLRFFMGSRMNCATEAMRPVRRQHENPIGIR
jgi:hypothetical protein